MVLEGQVEQVAPVSGLVVKVGMEEPAETGQPVVQVEPEVPVVRMTFFCGLILEAAVVQAELVVLVVLARPVMVV